MKIDEIKTWRPKLIRFLPQRKYSYSTLLSKLSREIKEQSH